MRLSALALAMALGGGGGAVFAAFNLPLPWMLGSMTACTVAALCGARPAVPYSLRALMIGILGIMLGSAFSPQLLERMHGWSASLAVLAVALTATTLVCMLWLRRMAGLGPVTAYFSAAPGGLNEMVMTGTAMGGDERTIALIHALRILLIVFTVPVAFRVITGVPGVSMATSMGGLADLRAVDAALLAGCAVGGVVAGRLLRFPAPVLTGPLAASAALHLAGLTAAHPPAELVMLAQVVTGAGLGSRFAGLRWKDIAATARLSLGSTALMVVLSAGGAGLAAWATGLPFSQMLLAFVPGGLAEMCLIALSLGQDVAFVSTHHMIRVILVVAAAPLVFRLTRRYWLKPSGTPDKEAAP